MRWARALLVVCLAAGCRFTVRAVDITGGSDLATVEDMAHPVFNDMGVCLCLAGCAETPTPHCKALQPSGPVSASDYDQPGLLGVSIAGMTVTFNTETGEIKGPVTRPAGPGITGGIGFRVAAQAGGPSVGVFSVAGFTLANGAIMKFEGKNAFALVSAGTVELDGTVDASCRPMNTPGPGGSLGGTAGMANGGGMGGGTAGGKIATITTGGGGGGYGDIGGSGAVGAGSTPNGGVTWGDLTSPTFILAGGAGGGQGGGPGADGGGGGGAVQFASNDELRVAGVITVGGCGGLGMVKKGGGGGGGSGGAIVLEAARVTLAATAVLAANGGGGGGGDGGKTGGNGNPSVMPAAGGLGAGMGGPGGNGGASNGMPGLHFTQGRDVAVGPLILGGGGGGCGRIAVRAAPNGITDNSNSISPDVSDTNAMGGKETVYGEAAFQ